MTTRKLQAVTDKTPRPPKKKPLTVKEAAETGVRRDLLVAMRSRISTDIDSQDTPARDLAALSRRLLEIVKEIEQIDAEDSDDDIGTAAATPDEAWVAT